uniref:Ubs_17 putative toxin n=1 Tax=Unedogemmula bisaya TaxID=746885 RepID=A0A098LXZ0_UNEBI
MAKILCIIVLTMMTIVNAQDNENDLDDCFNSQVCRTEDTVYCKCGWNNFCPQTADYRIQTPGITVYTCKRADEFFFCSDTSVWAITLQGSLSRVTCRCLTYELPSQNVIKCATLPQTV